jgi:hypothetical protein
MTCDLVHLEHEQPYQAIIDTAQNRGCDAIHMASHGRRGISAIVLGSETLKVLTQRHTRHRVSSATPSYPQGVICRVVRQRNPLPQRKGGEARERRF